MRIGKDKGRSRVTAVLAVSALSGMLIASGCGGSNKTAKQSGAPGSSMPSSSAGTKSTIVMGDIGIDSGPVAAPIVNAKPAMQAWAAYTNAHGGLNGHPVRIVYGDDAASPTTALSLVTKMVQQDHIVALIGLHTADSESTIVQYAASHGIPIIGPAPNDPVDENSADVFDPSTSDTPAQDINVTAFKSLNPNLKNIGIVYCTEATNCLSQAQAMKSYAPKAGMRVVYTGAASISSPSYTSQVLAAKEAGAQALVVIEGVNGIVELLKNAAQQDWYPSVEAGNVDYTSDLSAWSGLPSKAQLLLVAAARPWSLSPEMAPYRQAMAQYEPSAQLGDFGAAIWTGGELLSEVAPAFGSTVTSSDISAALLSLKGTTVGGLTPPLTFPEGANRQQVNSCGTVIELSGGKWVAPLGSDHFICTPPT